MSQPESPMRTKATLKRACRGAEPDVAGQRQRQPAAGGRPVDGGDHGLGHVLQRRRERGDQLLAAVDVERAVDRADGVVGLDVDAAAEAAPGAGQDRDPDRLVGADLGDRPVQLFDQLPAERVEPLGPFQDDPRDALGRRTRC